MRRPLVLALAALALISAPAAAESVAPITLQNDSFSGGPIVLPGGFAAGDTLAARFVMPGGGGTVIGLEVMVSGGGSSQLPVTVTVWDDTAQTVAPGPILHESPQQFVNLSPPVPQRIFLAGVVVSDRFRVGVTLGASPPPMIGHDTDGTIAADQNFVLHPATGWRTAQAAGIPGDWIIRAIVVPFGGGGGGGGDGGISGGEPCFGALCPAGQFCDEAIGQCTFECRTAADCGGAFCNRNGQCVGEGDCGSCQAGSGAGAGQVAGALLLALGVLAIVLRRRR